MAENRRAFPTDTISGRRYLTILFCDIVQFTELSEEVDPEDLKDIQQRYQHLGVKVIESYGGFVASFSGDGMLAYFGYPTAHENDAERAVRSALDLARFVPELEVRLHGRTIAPLAVRIGVHTGLVAIGTEKGSGPEAPHTVVGKPVNVASRLQTEAQPNAVVVSAETRELIDGLFDFELIGPRAIKGLSKPLTLYRPVHLRDTIDRFAGRARRGATHMVGRETELRRLLDQFEAVKATSRSILVVIEGEPGVGKTRLASELCHHRDLAGTQVTQLNCEEIFANSPLYPFASFVRANASLNARDDLPSKMLKLSEFLESLDMTTQEDLETAADLLELTDPGQQLAPTSQLSKQRRLEFLVRLLHSHSSPPTLLWIEDAHWLDPSSAEVLNLLVRDLAETQTLIVLTQRRFPAREDLPYVTENISLDQLPTAKCIELAHTVPGAKSLSESALRSIAVSSEGVPLFVEQLVLSLLAGRNAGEERITLPLTLAELLSERLDRLPDGRRIVQAASCIGRSFTVQSLATVLADEASSLPDSLRMLVDAEILRVQTDRGSDNYEFRHSLLQRVAHEAVAKADRQLFHSRAADALKNSEQSAAPIELVAYHLSEAGRYAEAVRAWLDAGISAARRSAHVEAIDHIRRGLALLPELPESAAIELALQAALIGPLSAARGATALEFSACCKRGLELCKSVPASPLIFPFLFGQFTFAMCRGHTPDAVPLAETFLSLADRNGYDSGKVIGYRLKGMAMLGQGRAADACTALEASLNLYSPARDDATTHMFGQNTQVHSRSLSSLAFLCLGKVERALELGILALRGADDLRHPHSTAIALGYVGGWVFGWLGATDFMTSQARRLIALAEQHKLGPFKTFGTAFLGWAFCQYGDLDQGIAVLDHAVKEFESVSFRMSISGHLAVLADAQRRVGRLDEAQVLCDRAKLWIEEGADKWLEPEVRRVAGLILRDRGGRSDHAAAELTAAADLARALGFPIFELRCLRSLLEVAPDDTVKTRISELEPLRHADRIAIRALQHADLLRA